MHAAHEQNCSTNAMRAVGSAHTDPYLTIAAAIAALAGPLHGGANEEVLRMLDEIGSKQNVAAYIKTIKDGKGKLMGFGHRVYKNHDPRARIIKWAADQVFARTGEDCSRGRLLREPQALSQGGVLFGDHLPGRRLQARDVHCAVRDPPRGRLAGAVAGDVICYPILAEDRAVAASVDGPRGTGVRADREEDWSEDGGGLRECAPFVSRRHGTVSAAGAVEDCLDFLIRHQSSDFVFHVRQGNFVMFPVVGIDAV